MLSGIQINKLGNILSTTLTSGDWKTIFTATSFEEFDNQIFMNDVIYGNDDLSHKCMIIMEKILEDNEENIKYFWEISNVPYAVERKDPDLHRVIEAYISGAMLKTVTDFPVNNVNENIYNVLKDAETLITQRGAGEAFDRVHTALHAMLRAICDKHSIKRKDDDRVDELLSLINSHLKVQKNSERNQTVFEMLRSANAILSKANFLRNQHSNAHPTNGLLNDADAKFAINLIRSIMSYVDDLLG
ncbi:abortive infection family protein [Enterobacter hormaechei]|nr:abortive infection family protein [Enterobacter hormaechei]